MAFLTYRATFVQPAKILMKIARESHLDLLSLYKDNVTTIPPVVILGTDYATFRACLASSNVLIVTAKRCACCILALGAARLLWYQTNKSERM